MRRGDGSPWRPGFLRIQRLPSSSDNSGGRSDRSEMSVSRSISCRPRLTLSPRPCLRGIRVLCEVPNGGERRNSCANPASGMAKDGQNHGDGHAGNGEPKCARDQCGCTAGRHGHQGDNRKAATDRERPGDERPHPPGGAGPLRHATSSLPRGMPGCLRAPRSRVGPSSREFC